MRVLFLALVASLVFSGVACVGVRAPSLSPSVAFLQVTTVRDRVRVIDLRISGEPEPEITRAYGAIDPDIPGLPEGASLRSAEGLWADNEDRVIDYYEKRLGPVTLVRDWRIDDKSVCRLYERAEKLELLLCSVYSKPGPESCRSTEAREGVLAVEGGRDESREVLRVGLKCSADQCWVFMALLPTEFLVSSSEIVDKMLGSLYGQCPLWCPKGEHPISVKRQ